MDVEPTGGVDFGTSLNEGLADGTELLERVTLTTEGRGAKLKWPAVFDSTIVADCPVERIRALPVPDEADVIRGVHDDVADLVPVEVVGLYLDAPPYGLTPHLCPSQARLLAHQGKVLGIDAGSHSVVYLSGTP